MEDLGYNKITTIKGALIFFGLVCAVLVGLAIIVYVILKGMEMKFEGVKLPGKGYKDPET